MAEIALSVSLFVIDQIITILTEKAKKRREIVPVSASDLLRRLDMMVAWLKDTEMIEGSSALQEQIKQVRELAYDIEDVLEEFIIQAPSHLHSHRISYYAADLVHFFTDHHNTFRNLSENMETLNKSIDSLNLPNPGASAGWNFNPQPGLGRRGDDVIHHALEDDEVIGYQDQKRSALLQILAQEPRTLSVVGPGGAGKTILIKNVIEKRQIKEQYSRRAWIDMSPPIMLNDVLLNMLSQFYGERNAQNVPRPEFVRDALIQYLRNEKFLVVLDSIRSRKDCDQILNTLPPGLLGSKIIVISQDSDVGYACVESTNHVIELNGLSEKDAWELFSKKAFGTGGTCPQDLTQWAKKIIRKCECMPYAVAAAGSFLSTRQKISVVWEGFYHSLGTDTGTSSNLWIISHILSKSFKDLPSHLRICFLYFSIFPDNYPVKRGRLIRSWIAEGFVKAKTTKTMEEVAEEYLTELIERNLVVTSEKEIDGRVKTCRVRNLDREFIVAKSKEEVFVEVLSESNTNLAVKARHLSVHALSTNFSKQRNCPFVRSLFVFDKSISFDTIQNLCREDRLLKTVDLQGTPLMKFPEAICNLVLLRRLCLRGTRIKKVPNSIKNLALLETLDLKQTLVTDLPDGISKLQNLRHLLVYRYDVKVYVDYDSAQGVEVPAGIEILTSLQKLSLVNVSKNKRIIKNLGKLAELRKLGLTHLKHEDGEELCSSIEKMKNLSTLDARALKNKILNLDSLRDPPRNLQRLYLKGCLNKVPGWIASLDSLIKIGLKWSKLQAHSHINPLQTLGAVPNLMELHLTDFYFGSELEFKAGKFKKLKILELEQFDNLNRVKIEHLALPLLEKLTIMKCRNLKSLPSGIDGLRRLEELHLYDMPGEFIDRLRKTSPEHRLVKHVRVIDSFTLRNQYPWFLKENLSQFFSNSNQTVRFIRQISTFCVLQVPVCVFLGTKIAKV